MNDLYINIRDAQHATEALLLLDRYGQRLSKYANDMVIYGFPCTLRYHRPYDNWKFQRRSGGKQTNLIELEEILKNEK
jgi:hypothetical protein